AEYAARLEYLRSLDQAILQSATMTQRAELVLESMEKMIPCNGAGVALFDSERGSADVLARCGDTAVLPPAGSQMSLADFDYTASDTPFTSILMDDLETTTLSAREIKRLVSQGVRAFLHVPLLSDDKLVGAIQLGANRPGTFTETHLQMARELAGQLAIGFQNAALAEEKRRRTQEMEAVTKAAAAMRQAKDRESMPPIILDILLDLFGAGGAALATRQVNGETIIELGRGSWEGWAGISLEGGKGIAGHVIATGQPYVCSKVSTDPYVYLPEEHGDLDAAAYVPLIAQETTIGALAIGRDTAVSDDELRILIALSNMTANAIQRATFHDETRRHAAELEERVTARTQQLADANKQLRELDQLKTKFVSDVSHELRTPITNLNLYLDLLRQGGPSQQERYLDVLQNEADRLRQLVEDILNLSRLEMGIGLAPTLRKLDLNELVKGVITANQPRAAARQLQLEFHPEPDLPLILAESNQLVQVVTNLLSNAINYTPQGFVRVSTWFDAQKRQVCLEVLDSGMGISAEDQVHLFDRFYRGHKVGQLNIPGTGLGLAIAQEIVALHGGAIDVESQPGQGSRFLVCLPVLATDA
ncbi:MAG: ATP-binding protein, partial [Anaerolineae bacterium]